MRWIDGLAAFFAAGKHRRSGGIGNAPLTGGQTAVVEAGSLQGIGSREEQQDAFGMSALSAYEEQGLFAVLCDGMGGMAEGARIARDAAQTMLAAYPWPDPAGARQVIQDLTARVFDRFYGQGGTTLVAVQLIGSKLHFCSVGDSDLFLIRDGAMYAMNSRQEFRNHLLRLAFDGTLSFEEAYGDPQAWALDEYIGKKSVVIDGNRRPFCLRPGDELLLCSDGVSDVLTPEQMREALMSGVTPAAVCNKLEHMILQRAFPEQDNYTAIVLKYNGTALNSGDAQ